MGQCWLVLGGTGPVLGGTGWFVVVMGQYGAVLIGTWWYWVSMERNWFILGGTGTGRYWLICDSTRSEWSRTG